MGELRVDIYRYECRICRQVILRYAPDDLAPPHHEPDTPNRLCPGVGKPAFFLSRTREPFPAAHDDARRGQR